MPKYGDYNEIVSPNDADILLFKSASEGTVYQERSDAISKDAIGLGAVDNTSDLDKPISTLTQTALNEKANASDIPEVANPYVEGATLYSMGHSYTIFPYPYGTKRSGEHQLRIKNRLRLGNVVILGRSGTPAADNMPRLVSPTLDSGSGLWTPNSKGICLIQNAMNELGTSLAADTLYRNLWAQSIRAEVAIMQSKTIKGIADASASSGTWTAGANIRDTKGINGTTYFAAHNSGAYKEWTVSAGDEVWVAGVVGTVAYNSVASFKVSCNGVDLVTFAGNGLKPIYTDAVIGTNIEYTPWFVRVTGLNAAAGTSGSKTIRVTPVTSQGNAFISGIVEPSPNPPSVFISKEPPRGNPVEANYAANIDWFDDTTDTICSEFTRVHPVQQKTGWDNTVMIASLDGANFHPNDIGQSKLADNYVDAINNNITSYVDGVIIK